MRKTHKNPDQLELFNIQNFTKHPNILTRADVSDVLQDIATRMTEIKKDIQEIDQEESILKIDSNTGS